MSAIDNVLERLEDVKRDGPGKWKARCKAHVDDKPSLSIKETTDGKVLLICRAGCATADVLAAYGLTMDDLFDKPSNGNGKGAELVVAYDYVDESGKLLYQNCRLVPKDFFARRPNGRGGWLKKMDDTRRVLFHLPQLIAGVAAGQTVYLCEGEKDVLAVEKAGAIATTKAFGARSPWLPEYSEFLRSARVRIIAHRDAPNEAGVRPGYEVATREAKALQGIAASVEILETPVEKAGADAADHLGAGKTLDELVPPDLAGESDDSAPAEGYELAALDWQALLRDGVPPVEYLREPYFIRAARTWIFGATGTTKSLYVLYVAAELSRKGVRVSYFSEENPLNEDLRRLSLVRPDPAFFRMFQRTGMDLADPRWVAAMLEVTNGDDLVAFDSLTDVWSGNGDDNREIAHFDATVLKPLQCQGAASIIIDHTGHPQQFVRREGASAGRGASAKGQKADVTLTFKDAGDGRFIIVYGKPRIGGIRQPDTAFVVSDDVDDAGEKIITIEPVENPELIALSELVEKMVGAITTVEKGYLTTRELKEVAPGKRERQTAAMEILSNDPRVHVAQEKVETRDGAHRTSTVWRPTGGDHLDENLELFGANRSSGVKCSIEALAGDHFDRDVGQAVPEARGPLGDHLPPLEDEDEFEGVF